MELSQVRQIRILPIRYPGKLFHLGQDEDINKMLLQGWRVLGIHTEEYYGGMGANDVRSMCLVLGHPDEIPPRTPSTDGIEEIVVERQVARAKAYMRAGWALVATEPVSPPNSGPNHANSWFVLGRREGARQPDFEDAKTDR
jgi:hypothetical protein